MATPLAGPTRGPASGGRGRRGPPPAARSMAPASRYWPRSSPGAPAPDPPRRTGRSSPSGPRPTSTPRPGRIAARARTAEVVYLGELHDNPQHHAIQARVLEAIIATGSRPALAFEMIPETGQAALEAAVRSDAGRAEVDQQLGWSAQGWPDFAMYWPLFELARKHRLPVVGTDLDPAVARRIGRGGLARGGRRPCAAPVGLARRSRARPRHRRAAPGGALRSDQRGPREPDARELVRAQRGDGAPRGRRARARAPGRRDHGARPSDRRAACPSSSPRSGPERVSSWWASTRARPTGRPSLWPTWCG